MLEKGLTTVKPGEELYLTDVMSELGARGDLVAYDFDGIRYDMGNKLGIMKANCEVASSIPKSARASRLISKSSSRPSTDKQQHNKVRSAYALLF